MAVYPSPWGGRVSKLRNTTKRFQPTETVTNPNVCALDDALMAVLPLESALARARWPSEHAFGRPNGPTAIQIAKTIAHTIGFVTESQSRSLTLPDHVALSRAKTAKTRSQTVCCKNHQRSVRYERPRNPHHGPAVAQNAQILAPGRAQTAWERRMGGGFAPTKLPPSHKPAPVFASSAPRTLASLPLQSADVLRMPLEPRANVVELDDRPALHGLLGEERHMGREHAVLGPR